MEQKNVQIVINCGSHEPSFVAMGAINGILWLDRAVCGAGVVAAEAACATGRFAADVAFFPVKVAGAVVGMAADQFEAGRKPVAS